MSGFLAVFTVTIVLTFVFVIVIAGLDLEEIKADWPNRRCELGSMLFASFFNTKDSGKTGTEFAKDNFSFCNGKIAETVLKTAFAPFYALAKTQVGGQAAMASVLNSIRGQIAKAAGTWNAFLQRTYQRFAFVTLFFNKVQQHIMFAFGRISSFAMAIVYFGLSMGTTILNMQQFTLNTILIVIGLMIAAMILMFFVLLPFFPLIITVIAILAEAGLAVGGMAGAFCIDPSATVVLADGTEKALRDVRLGDELKARSGLATNKVTGVLTVDATTTPLVQINGVQMSGTHRVLHNGKWVLAKDHPLAKTVEGHLQHLICLNTEQHEVCIRAAASSLYVSDWEEVSTEEGERAWIDWVHTILNGSHHRTSYYPTAVPLMGPTTKVLTARGLVSISTLSIGDVVAVNESSTAFGKVLGIYEGQFTTDRPPDTPEWLSDGVWKRLLHWWAPVRDGVPEAGDGQWLVQGVMLVVEGGQYVVNLQGKTVLVRDFTEVGAEKVNSAHSMLDSFINSTKK